MFVLVVHQEGREYIMGLNRGLRDKHVQMLRRTTSQPPALGDHLRGSSPAIQLLHLRGLGQPLPKLLVFLQRLY